MAERRDAFEALRRASPPLAPRPEFAASLRRRIEQELGMTLTDQPTDRPSTVDGTLGLVHFRVRNADRAMAFFGSLFAWEGERVEFERHVSHYVSNTQVTVRILDDLESPPVVPNYQVGHVADVIRRIEAAGGTIRAAEAAPDGAGWARAVDDQEVPFFVYQPGRYHARSTTRPVTGDVGLVFIRCDSMRARPFYEHVLGWHLEPGHPGSYYYEAVPRVGVFDEAAAFKTTTPPSVTLYLAVEALVPALQRVEDLGGEAGPAAQDMGPYYTAMCRDDQGTAFGLMSTSLD